MLLLVLLLCIKDTAREDVRPLVEGPNMPFIVIITLHRTSILLVLQGPSDFVFVFGKS